MAWQQTGDRSLPDDPYTESLAQDCSNSIGNTLELLHSCTKLSIHALSPGADIDAVDQFGDSALAVASRFGHKGCERHLFLFRWQQRAKKIRPHVEHEMFAHQYFDSAFPVWLKGEFITCNCKIHYVCVGVFPCS